MVRVTGPGPTLAATFEICDSAADGGGRLERTAAANSAAVASVSSTPTSRPSGRATPATCAGTLRIATNAGVLRRRLTAASTSAAANSPIFTSNAVP